MNTPKVIVANVVGITDNWDVLKNSYVEGYFQNDEYKYALDWHCKQENSKIPTNSYRYAFPTFRNRFCNGGLTFDGVDFVVKAGYLSFTYGAPIASLLSRFTETKHYECVVPNKGYNLIDITKFDGYAYFSFLSSVIWRLRLLNLYPEGLSEQSFDYDGDNFVYVFLTGEEADYDKLSEEKKALVDLKKEEAKVFLRTLHSSIVETLKQMFKENS